MIFHDNALPNELEIEFYNTWVWHEEILPELESRRGSARNPMVFSVNKMALSYARSLSETFIWVRTSYTTHASITWFLRI